MNVDDRQGLRSLDLKIHYEGTGDIILHEFVVPAVSQATAYDRLTGYFSVESLLAIAQGLEGLWRRGGRMRLVLGIHDVPKTLLEATLADSDWVDRVVEEVRRRLLDQVSTLRDEFQRNRLATLAWMLRDGLLQIRVAAPASQQHIPTAAGIFHSKRLIFTDEKGDRVTAVGSPNETVPGFSTNYEELTVHMSWAPAGQYVKVHVEQFERIWDNKQPALSVRVLHKDFADELLRHLDKVDKPTAQLGPLVKTSLFGDTIDAARAMRDYAVFALGRASLYPHQERVYLDALSRWPVRVMLADEVGLGKTLEAGSIISYMLRFGGAKRIIILAPRNVMRQWQEELINHFNLDFWIYSSETKSYVSAKGEIRPLTGASPVGKASPERVIISAQFARGMKGPGHIFSQTSILPDLVVLDEAHAARVRPDLDGKLKPTRLWRLADALSKKVPHLLLLTATPLQMHWEEYHSLLALLGLPPGMQEGEEYRRSLRLISASTPPSLEDAKWVMRWLKGSLTSYELDGSRLGPDKEAILRLAVEKAESPSLKDRQVIMKDWKRVHEALVRLHPAHLLTIRNTRSALAPLGYRFPERRLNAPSLQVPEDVREFYRAVEQYLANAYGRVDQALHPDKRVNLGFAKSSYHQRLASSLHAARISLERRSQRLEAVLAGAPLESEDDEADEAGEQDLDDEVGMTADQHERLAWAVKMERVHIKGLLDILDRLPDERDPKLVAMAKLVEQHVGDDQLLVFSRYTDTVEGCLAEFYRAFPADRVPGHAVYTGGQVWIDAGTGRVPANKQEVKRALDTGEVRVVFCSDAASEGLNLQAARVIINVDVPWNPARLEQRIGRIARLGQRADIVDVYNLWYPDSVEARMYGRLLERRELYELAVGECPELFSEAIRAEVASRLDADSKTLGVDPVATLQELRRHEQHQAMQQVWNTEVDPAPQSTALREALLTMLIDLATTRGWTAKRDGSRATIGDGKKTFSLSTEPGREDTLNLSHPVWEEFRAVAPKPRDGPQAELVALSDGDRPLSLAIKWDSRIYPVGPSELPALLRSLTTGEPYPLPTTLDLPRWTPVHDRMRTSNTDLVAPAPTASARANAKPLGRIAIEAP